MDKIQVCILSTSNMDGFPLFLAKLTQRGSEIKDMDDIITLLDDNKDKKPSEGFMKLPHTTLRRMSHITVAITGLSTKAVSQLRTHATRLTFLSTSTQYSKYDNVSNAFVIPKSLRPIDEIKMDAYYKQIQTMYSSLIANGVDKDIASYLLPQGLRKGLIIDGPLDAWEYVMQTRLCNRNTQEVQWIMWKIRDVIERHFGEEFTVNMWPHCHLDGCKEGKFCCGKKFTPDFLPQHIKERSEKINGD